MPLASLGVTVFTIAIGLYLIRRFLLMTSRINWIFNITVAASVCIWLVQASGLWANLLRLRVPR